jgi:hypothetical protein
MYVDVHVCVCVCVCVCMNLCVHVKHYFSFQNRNDLHMFVKFYQAKYSPHGI